jgi:hypothetical protein
MSKSGNSKQPEDLSNDEPSQGPNLFLIYGLLGLAFLIAIVVAAFIVLPFYQRR